MLVSFDALNADYGSKSLYFIMTSVNIDGRLHSRDLHNFLNIQPVKNFSPDNCQIFPEANQSPLLVLFR